MTLARDEIIATIWRGHDPFAAIEPSQPLDTQGWNSGHRYLTEAIDARSAVAVDVGVWKGGSTVTMAERMRDNGCDGVIVAIDTWCGSAEHWPVEGLYGTFANNVAVLQLRGWIVPVPLDSASACEVLARAGVHPGAVHIDAAHDYLSVMSDLIRWWGLLAKGGVLIADDYGSNAWPEVTRVVDHFRMRTPHIGFEAENAKCRLYKP
jgi:hypothetical protein